MDKENSNQSEFLRDTYRVVAEGLKAMQRLQSQTAEAHHKFLETQSAANRALQEMVKSVQLLAGTAPAVTSDAGQSEDSLVNTPQSVPLIRAADPTRQVGERRYQSPPPVPAGAHKNQTRPPSPSDLNLQHAAANGYGTDHNLPEQDPEPKPTTSESTPGIESVMLEIVSRLTGYPIEMLGMDMDIEAELGIDSIKRVEILSTLEEQLPDLPPVSPDLMGSLKTLGQIVQYLSGGDPDRSQKNRSEQIVPAEIPTTATASVDSTANHARDLTTVILAVVSRLTGYPTEMLGMDMDIEAELGIDSIKRVEILSSLEEEMPGLPAVSPDVMGTLKTLGQVVAYFRTAEEKNSTTEAAEKAPSEAVSAIAADEMGTVAAAAATAGDPVIAPLARNIVTIADAPPVSGNTIAISGSKKVFVTEDNTGLSEEITEELSKMNVKTVKISPDILKYRKQLPPAAGLIIVQDPESGKMDQDLEEAFTLAQHLAPDLIASAHDRGAVFATITRLDGAFGLKRKNLKHPVQGGLAGLAKTAAIEWENVCCHAIDIAPEWTDNRAIASAVVKEVMSAGPIEIGLDLNSRCTLSLQNAPLPMGSIHLNENDVVIISGGARGVTAAAAVELARHTGCKMVLLGRSPQPAAEPGWLSALEDEAEIKKAILENEFHGQNASLADIEKSYRRYMANREIAINMRRLKAIGTQFNYYSADVRDYEATCAIINHIRENIGPISVIIHGAGVLEDRLITAKTVDQFRRVYDTKVKGLNNLLKATQNDSLKFLILFSSVAARTGNKGQVDYAMANEVLNKVAQVESSRRGDCRVKSINWGPWDGGMVTPALKRQFERSGINLIPIESGAQAMLGEMMDMRNGPVEVIIGGELPATAAIAQNRLKRPELVKSTPAVRKNQLALSFDRKIDIHQYPVLQSHVIDGKPVVPLALMTEWFAHGALHENPGLILHGLDDIRVMKGIRLEQNQAHIQLLAGKPRKNKGAYEVEIELRDGKSAGRNITHARATAILSGNRAPAPNYQLSTPMVAQAYTRTMTEVYDKILFHGPQLHGILKIVSCSARGMVAHISTAPPPQEWMTAPLRNQWIADPLAIDCAFQMATVWCFEEKGLVSLPSYAASYRQYSSCFPGDSVTVVLEIKATANRKMQGDFTFLDSNDRTIASLKGYEAIMDASLFKAFQPQYRASA